MTTEDQDANASADQNSATQRTFSLILAYDGTRYGGWQRQKNSLAIQECLEKALASALGSTTKTVASGRTDSGVHAFGQVVRFRTSNWRHEAYKLVPTINRYMPRDMAVQEVREMVTTFNPIRDATSKSYRYTIRSSKSPDPFDDRVAWYIPRRLDYELLEKSARYLVGTHDFVSFERLGSPRITTVRNMMRLDVHRSPARFGTYIHLDFEADGFLYNMVRNISGTLVSIATRGLPAETILEILLAKNRKLSAQNAPACGLCLMYVNYPDSVYLQ
jgi:tRNA pseudouridine38-40 synthase